MFSVFVVKNLPNAKYSEEMANSVDPDQTAPLGGLTLVIVC